MSRRDTIIVAVLLNAGVLAILFMMAVNTDEEKVSDQSEISHEIVRVQEPTQQPELRQPLALAKEVHIDEVDSVLNDYVSASQNEPVIPYEDQSSYEEKYAEKDSSLQDRGFGYPSPQSDIQDAKFVEVTVKKGDVLERIARANGTTVEAIKKANNLKSERLKIGQTLRVPVATNKKSVAAKQNAINQSKQSDSKDIAGGDEQYYTIKSGDNPWKVAKQFHVKMDDLLKMNNLNEEKARNLKPGDKIRVK